MRAFDFLGAYMHDENGPGQTNLTAGQLHLAVYPVSVTTQLAGNRPRADAKTFLSHILGDLRRLSQNRMTQKILTGTTERSVQHLVCLHALSCVCMLCQRMRRGQTCCKDWYTSNPYFKKSIQK